MRPIIAPPVFAAAALLLAACANTGAGNPSYARQYEALERDCIARGGVLVDLGRTSSNVAADYACRLQDPNVPG